MLDKKCLLRDVSYQTIDDFFTLELTKEAFQHWQATLGNLVIDLPECELVLTETRQLLSAIVPRLAPPLSSRVKAQDDPNCP